MPAMQEMAANVDKNILRHMYNSIDDYMPQLPKLTRWNAFENVTRASEILDNHQVPAGERRIILDPVGESAILRSDAFTELRALNLALNLAPSYINCITSDSERRGTSYIFHHNAMAFVTRPFAYQVPLGHRSAIAHYNDICIRLTMSYDAPLCGTRVRIEMLSGLTILNSNWIVALNGGGE